MAGRFPALVILFLVLPAFALQNDSNIVFQDNFDHGNANNWQMITLGSNGPGNWSISGGMLNAATGDYASGMILVPADVMLNQSNYTIEADVMVTRGQYDASAPLLELNGDVYIGAIEPDGTGYFTEVSPYNNPSFDNGYESMCIDTIPTTTGYFLQSNRVCGHVPTVNQLDVWYNITFVRAGSEVSAYRDGQLIVQEDVGSTSVDARPGLFFYEGSFEVENFTVYANNTPELDIVDGKLNAPLATMQGSTFTASATIINDGTANATGFNVTFYSGTGGGQSAECTKRIEGLDVNGSVNVSCDINATDAGILDLSVLADSANEVNEIDRSGDSATARVIVGPQPDKSVQLLLVAAAIIAGLAVLGVLFTLYKGITHTPPTGSQLVKCGRCGMMLSPGTKKCPVCGEDVGTTS